MGHICTFLACFRGDVLIFVLNFETGDPKDLRKNSPRRPIEMGRDMLAVSKNKQIHIRYLSSTYVSMEEHRNNWMRCHEMSIHASITMMRVLKLASLDLLAF